MSEILSTDLIKRITRVEQLIGTNTRAVKRLVSSGTSSESTSLTINNNVDGRLLTANGTTTSIDGEANLSFVSNKLVINGMIDMEAANDCTAITRGNYVPAGNGNTIIGAMAGEAIGAINNCTVVGVVALQSGVSAWRTTAIGGHALRRLTTSDTGRNGNTAVGTFAMEWLTVGSYNVALGGAAGDQLSTGDNNIFIGGECANSQANSTTTYSGCILIGAWINAGNLTALSNTTVIGAFISTTLSNVVILGRGDQNTLIGGLTADNGSRLQIKGDTELTDVGNAYIVKSPDGTRWKIGVSNAGVPTVVAA